MPEGRASLTFASFFCDLRNFCCGRDLKISRASWLVSAWGNELADQVTPIVMDLTLRTMRDNLRARIEKDVLDSRRRNYPYHQMPKAPGEEPRDRHSFRSNNIARWINGLLALGAVLWVLTQLPSEAGAFRKSDQCHTQPRLLARFQYGDAIHVLGCVRTSSKIQTFSPAVLSEGSALDGD